MVKILIFQFGKPSISMGYLYHGYVSHNQGVYRRKGDHPGRLNLVTPAECLGHVYYSYVNLYQAG